MTRAGRYLTASEAARELGLSVKALRLYEARGLLAPVRSAAGWRAYGPDTMERARRIATLRALGLGLGRIAVALAGDPRDLDAALAAHRALLEDRQRKLRAQVDALQAMRADLVPDRGPEAGEGAQPPVRPPDELSVSFALPYPWGGERFTCRDIRRLNFIVGPLGSGKTRLAMRIAETLPDAAFLGLDRMSEGETPAARPLDPALASRVDAALAWLTLEGATRSNALVALVAGLEAERPAVLVIDMVEQGLDRATQEAVISYLRHRWRSGRRLFLLTRSNVILDLEAVGPEETITFCPANHGPPIRVRPHPGAPGYEAVATCLASPEVRTRTAGVIAWRPRAAA